MSILEEILNVIFPNVCGFCEKLDKNSLCEECEKKFDFKSRYVIHSISDKYFEKQIYLMRYEGIFREKILSYKFDDKSYLYKTFAKIILKNEKICQILTGYDIITSIPIHKKRKNERGYNQSELIAKEIARNIRDFKYLKFLNKIKNTQKQSLLGKNERENNAKDAYEVINEEIICNKKIIIFDDIYTTGATANECARLLKENGAKEILILSLAK